MNFQGSISGLVRKEMDNNIDDPDIPFRPRLTNSIRSRLSQCCKKFLFTGGHE